MTSPLLSSEELLKMPKTKEWIKAYNKEYFARPHVIARAKIRNAQRRHKRREYKKTLKGKQAERRYQMKVYPLKKDIWESRRLEYLYGITAEEHKALLIKQNNACSICKVIPKTTLHVDHCHATNKVRGLLCGNCNRAIGLMKDNPEFFMSAANYLTS